MVKNKLLKTILFASSLFIMFSCTKSSAAKGTSAAVADSTLTSSKSGIKLKHLNQETKEYLSEKTIAVILGHSYNDEITVSKLKYLLNLNFGLKTEQVPGLITVMVYPEDFLVAGKVRLSNVYSVLEDKKLAGLITVGAPEGLCNAIAKLEDKEENCDESGKRLYPVYSFFPQDDILGSESTSDFVLDYVQQSNGLEEQEDFIPYELSGLLTASVQSMINLRGPVPADINLEQFVQKLAGKQKKISCYRDSETGLKSINHFIFE